MSDQCYQPQGRIHSTLTFTMNVKSVKAGEYTAPPAQGPIMREICGTTPEHRTFLCSREKKKKKKTSSFTKKKSLFKSVHRFCKNTQSYTGEDGLLQLVRDKYLEKTPQCKYNQNNVVAFVLLPSVPIHLISYTME